MKSETFDINICFLKNSFPLCVPKNKWNCRLLEEKYTAIWKSSEVIIIVYSALVGHYLQTCSEFWTYYLRRIKRNETSFIEEQGGLSQEERLNPMKGD